MRLDDLVFDPNDRPAAQMSLKKIPLAARVDHPKLKITLAAYEAARIAEHDARLTHVQLEQELPASEHADEVALADAREKGKKDPGPIAADRARRAVSEAKRDHGARMIALERSVQNVVQSFEDHGADYEAHLTFQRDDLRGVLADLLAGVDRVVGELRVTVANLALGSGSQAPTSAYCTAIKVPRVMDGDVVAVADVLQGLRDLAAPADKEDRPTRPTVQEKVTAWARSDEAEGRARGAGLSERKAERSARASSARAGREAALEEANAALSAS